MAKYTVTASCGHDYITNLIGPSKNREWMLQHLAGELCPACKEEARKASIEFENKVSAEKSAEMELPELEGSPKQIAWANSIKVNLIEKMTIKAKKVKAEYADQYAMFTDYILNNTSAKFFIDHRDDSVSEMFAAFIDEHKDEDVKAEIKEETTETVKTDETVKPGVAEIAIEKDTIKAIYMRDSDFIALVKSLEFKWNGKCWTKKITKYNGGIQRAVELGHRLLKSGFAVNADKSLISDMVSGAYEEECHNWIDVKKGDVIIIWEKYISTSESNYQESKKIHGAKYKDGQMTVPAESFDEIRDFAEVNGFRITEEAENLMKKAEETRNNATTVEVAEHEEEKELSKEERLNEIMADDEIITDLLDEDEETDIDKINKLGYSIVKGVTVGKKITQDVRGKSVSVWTPSGELRNICGSFDQEITFAGSVKIKVRELVRFAYGYDEKKLAEVERCLTDEQVEEFQKRMDEIGLKEIVDCIDDEDVLKDFNKLDVDCYALGNTGVKVCSDVDDWSMFRFEFDHEPSISDINEALNIDHQMTIAKIHYKA